MKYVSFVFLALLASCSSLSSRNRTQKLDAVADEEKVYERYVEKKEALQKPFSPQTEISLASQIEEVKEKKKEETPRVSEKKITYPAQPGEVGVTDFRISDEQLKKKQRKNKITYQQQVDEFQVEAADNYDAHTVTLTDVELQHPVTREIVKCHYKDVKCLKDAENDGFYRLEEKPRFTGKEDIPTSTGYPTRKWRDNNIIPRF